MHTIPTVKIGIEHEFVFIDQAGRYLDAENSDYELFQSIVDGFPLVPGDDAVFECKSLEKQPKRCYVEGFEEHAPNGQVTRTLPKGIEIRTLPHTSIKDVVTEFQISYSKIMKVAKRRGLSPVLTSRHPFKSSFSRNLANDSVESAVRTEQQINIAIPAMFSHGLHVNVSMDDYSLMEMEDQVQKLHFYVPFLIPYSFSSPFYEDKDFMGLCSRNYFRAGTRQMTELHQRNGAIVLEFRAFDACGDEQLLTALLTLFKGFLLDKTLTERSSHQSEERLKQSSVHGFADPFIKREGRLALNAAKLALAEEAPELELLEVMLEKNDSYAARMKRRYFESGDIIKCISNQYDFQSD